MRPFRLIALAVAVLALGAFIWFYERHTPSTAERAERKDALFPLLEEDAVERIVVRNSHGRFELARDGEEWQLVAPLTDRANASSVTSLLSSLKRLKAERTLAAADVKLADYGLDPAPLEVEVTAKGQAPATLRLGSELPLGNSRAALTAEAGSVYLVNKWIASDIDRDLAGWRSTDLADLVATDIASISLRRDGGRIALARAGGAWTLTEPVADLADWQRAQDLIGDLNSAQIKEFVDQPGDLAGLGLAAPAAELTVVRATGTPLQLAFGAEREVDGARQVACRRAEGVLWVEGTVLAHLTAELADWRARSLVKLDTWDAEALTLTAGGASATLSREEGVWRASDVEVDGDAVSRRLRSLADLQVTGFDRPVPGGEALGSVVVTVQDGAKVEATFFAGSGAGEAVATVPGRPGALAVDRVLVEELLADPPALARPRPTPAPTATPEPTAAAS